MPDWSYQTVFRPLLRLLEPRQGLGLALGFMGALGRMPWGTRVIEWMGHMRPDPRLRTEIATLEFSTRVGLSCRFDGKLQATSALAQFGLAYQELGPVVLEAANDRSPVAVLDSERQIRIQPPHDSVCVEVALRALKRSQRILQRNGCRIFVRIETSDADELQQLATLLHAHADAWIVTLEIAAGHLDSLRVQDSVSRPALVSIEPSQWQTASVRDELLRLMSEGSIQGIVLHNDVAPDGSLVLGRDKPASITQAIHEMRMAFGQNVLLICGAGVVEPADALDMIDAGADLIQIDAGLVLSGPGLPKRINEAVLFREIQKSPPKDMERATQSAWFWILLMGLGMLVGGVLAMAVATTRVVLPYDEAMAGLTREQLHDLNDRLLAFMTHDRVTLAGTMLSVGIIYSVLAWCAIRRGIHWAWVSVCCSAFAGFASFFTFLGFGYFDPFHAFVTAVLFQLLLLGLHSDLPLRHSMEPPDLWDDRAWKWNQWGQLIYVVHGAVLIVAGVVISIVGMTTVFVPEDLEFMCTSAEELYGAHPRLVPLVAHDRATFGGMLVACGVVTLLSSLWGFRRGQSWLWWSLTIGGSIAYLATIAVHWTVGYDSLKHLLPAYGGLALLWTGSALSYAYLVRRDENLLANWQARCQTLH